MGRSIKSGIAISGMVFALSGCLASIEEDIPFVSRFKSDEPGGAALAASTEQSVDENKTKNPFSSLFKSKNADENAETATQFKSSEPAKPFLARFKSKDSGAGGFFSGNAKTENAVQRETKQRAKESAESHIISGLQGRRSLLESGSAFGEVSSAVLAANSRAAEAELRAARLRSVAASKNWLPSIGPSISLSSLGDLVANLVVEQVLFDNGRKKAERAYAKADVEVAAVNLSMDTNDRVHTALGLYLTAQKALEKSELSKAAFNDMSHFEYIMSERVRGGVSDRSDLVVLRQKLSEIKSDMAANAEDSATAMAELNAMSIRPLSGVKGISRVSVENLSTQPLPVLLAEAEKERDIAEATMERAGHLPGLSAGGTVGNKGNNLGLNVTTDKLFGLGTGASLKAIEATKDAASRRVAQAQEDSNRKLRSLERKLSGVQRQAREADGLTSQAKKNLDLFQAQYKAGTRQVMDVVGVYETFASQQQSAADLKYQAAIIRLAIANELGVLASGEEI